MMTFCLQRDSKCEGISKFQYNRKYPFILDSALMECPRKQFHRFSIQYVSTCDKNRKERYPLFFFFWLVERVIYFIIRLSILFLLIFIYALDNPLILLFLNSCPPLVFNGLVGNVQRQRGTLGPARDSHARCVALNPSSAAYARGGLKLVTSPV